MPFVPSTNETFIDKDVDSSNALEDNLYNEGDDSANGLEDNENNEKIMDLILKYREFHKSLALQEKFFRDLLREQSNNINVIEDLEEQVQKVLDEDLRDEFLQNTKEIDTIEDLEKQLLNVLDKDPDDSVQNATEIDTNEDLENVLDEDHDDELKKFNNVEFAILMT